MRKIYQKYFALPEEGKDIMGEQVFFARLAVSITCIVLCMTAMGFTAYAYFTASISSNMNQIQAASFDLEVQEIEPQTEASSASYEAEKTYRLKAGSIYKFVLAKHGNASTGYCKIVLTPNDETSKETSEAVFYTQQFGQVGGQNETINEREIYITVGVETTVKFVPCWGTYSGAGVGEVKYAMDVKEVTTTEQPEAQSEPKETTSTESVDPTDIVTPTESTNIPESTVMQTQDKKEEESSNETESDTVKSAESTEDITTSTNTTE